MLRRNGVIARVLAVDANNLAKAFSCRVTLAVPTGGAPIDIRLEKAQTDYAVRGTANDMDRASQIMFQCRYKMMPSYTIADSN